MEFLWPKFRIPLSNKLSACNFFPCNMFLFVEAELSPEHSNLESVCVNLKSLWCHHDAALEQNCLFPRMGPCQGPCSQAPLKFAEAPGPLQKARSRERGLCRGPVPGKDPLAEGLFPGTGPLQRVCSRERPLCRGSVPGNAPLAEGLFPGTFPSAGAERALQKNMFERSGWPTLLKTPPILGSHFNRGERSRALGETEFCIAMLFFGRWKLPIFWAHVSAAQIGHFNAIWVGFQQGGTIPSVEATTRFTRLFQQCGLPGSFKHVKF